MSISPVFGGRYKLKADIPPDRQPQTDWAARRLKSRLLWGTEQALSKNDGEKPWPKKNAITLFQQPDNGTWTEHLFAGLFDKTDPEQHVVYLVDDARGNDATDFRQAIKGLYKKFGGTWGTLPWLFLGKENAARFYREEADLYRKFTTEDLTEVTMAVDRFEMDKSYEPDVFEGRLTLDENGETKILHVFETKREEL